MCVRVCVEGNGGKGSIIQIFHFQYLWHTISDANILLELMFSNTPGTVNLHEEN